MPLLLLLITAILQFGSMYSQYTTIVDAARVGARELSLGGGPGYGNICDLAVAQTISSTAGDVTLQPSDVALSFPNSTNNSDYCGKTSSGTVCTQSQYVYNTTCNTNGSETVGDEAEVTITHNYTLTVFGMGIWTIPLHTTAAEAIE